MNYAKIYDSLITTRRNKGIPREYKEIHHIIPKSFGGSDDENNLIALTAREHFIAHRLLAKMYPNTGMVHAVFKMACINNKKKRFKVTSRVYEHLRIAHAQRVSTDEVSRLKKSNAGKGKKQSDAHIKARIESRKQNGKPWTSDITKQNMSKPHTKISVRRGRKHSSEQEKLGHKKGVETRRKNGSYKITEEQKKARSERMKLNPIIKPSLSDEQRDELRKEKTKKVTCPHCGKVGTMLIMPRWHFNNCKAKKES